MGYTWEQSKWAELHLHVGSWKYEGKEPVLLLKHFFPTADERKELQEQKLLGGKILIEATELRKKLTAAYEQGQTDEHIRHIRQERENGGAENSKTIIEQWLKIQNLQEQITALETEVNHWRTEARNNSVDF